MAPTLALRAAPALGTGAGKAASNKIAWCGTLLHPMCGAGAIFVPGDGVPKTALHIGLLVAECLAWNCTKRALTMSTCLSRHFARNQSRLMSLLSHVSSDNSSLKAGLFFAHMHSNLRSYSVTRSP